MKNDNHSAAQIQMWWENGHGNLLYDLTCGFIIDFEEKRREREIPILFCLRLTL